MGAGSGGEKNGLNTECNSKAELIRFADEFDMGGGKRMKRVKVTLRFFFDH